MSALRGCDRHIRPTLDRKLTPPSNSLFSRGEADAERPNWRADSDYEVHSRTVADRASNALSPIGVIQLEKPW